MKLIYVAGPLFSVAERVFNSSLKARLLPYANVFLPQEDGGLVCDLVSQGATPIDAARSVFQMDLAAIHRCDVLLIVMDGRSIDEGAAVELGIAYSLGKLCVGLQTDSRRLLGTRNNPMVDCSLHAYFTSEQELISWVSSNLNSQRRASDSISTPSRPSV